MDPVVIHYILDGLTIVASIAGAWFVARLRSKAQNRLDEAGAAKAVSEAAERLISPLTKRVDELDNKLKERDALIEDLREWIERLIKQVKRHHDTPVKFIARRSHLTKE